MTVTGLNSTPGTATLRAFIAIPITEILRQTLADLQTQLKPIGADVNWMAPGNLHLTLAFLGDILETQVPAVQSLLDTEAAKCPAVTLGARGLGTFGRPHAPRVIWAGLHGETAPLNELQARLIAGLKPIGIYPDTKPFKAHLTIGRIRSARRGQELLAAIEAEKDRPIGPLEITRLLFMQSRLTPTGPIYAVRHESRLSAAG